MKNLYKIFGIIALVAIIGIELASCASTPKAPPGTLTITGLPEEYEGKFVYAGINRILKNGGYTSAATTGEYTAVENGEVRLPVYKATLFGKAGGYTGSDNTNIEIYIKDTLESTKWTERVGNDALFEMVTFENGVAEVTWDKAIKATVLTISNIPASYNEKDFVVKFNDPNLQINAAAKALIALTGGVLDTADATEGGTINDGVIRVKAIGYVEVDASTHARARASWTDATRDIQVKIILNYQEVAKTGGTVQLPGETDTFLFKDVQITDCKVDLDFARGVKQPGNKF